MKANANGYEMSITHQLITPSDAQAMLDLYGYDGQRALREGNLDYLVDEMKRERFAPFTVLTLCVAEDGTYLTDGRHRLHAVVMSGKAQWFWLMEIKGNMSPADIFIVQDVNAGRTQMNLLKALQTMEGSDIPLLSKGAITAAVKHLTFGPNHHPKIHARDLHVLVREWIPYLEQYGAAIHHGSVAQQMRSSVFAAAGAVTFRHCPEKAQAFWRGMSYDDGLGRYDPRKRAVNLLRDDGSVFRAAGGMAALKSFRILAYLWNKYLSDEEVKKMPSLAERFVFDGTGWGA